MAMMAEQMSIARAFLGAPNARAHRQRIVGRGLCVGTRAISRAALRRRRRSDELATRAPQLAHCLLCGRSSSQPFAIAAARARR